MGFFRNLVTPPRPRAAPTPAPVVPRTPPTPAPPQAEPAPEPAVPPPSAETTAPEQVAEQSTQPAEDDSSRRRVFFRNLATSPLGALGRAVTRRARLLGF